MKFSELPPSKQWAALKYRGDKIADVWFKPDGEPHALIFRIAQKAFHLPAIAEQLTMENLLRAVAISPDEIESWRSGDVAHAAHEPDPELNHPIAPPSQNVPHLEIHVRLRPQFSDPSAETPNVEAPQQHEPAPEQGEPTTQEADPAPTGSRVLQNAGGAAGGPDSDKGDASQQAEGEVRWQELDARWKMILGLEATIDTLRISMESLMTELEAALKKTLTPEEKIHARRADVADWDRAKNRVHYALPKVREAIHRAVWALGSPERKQLAELYKSHIQPQIPFPEMGKVLEQLEYLQKDRQILSAHGVTVYHESRNVAASVQTALRTLQSNAAANAQKKKEGAAGKGKFFKQVRRWSGAE